MDVCLCLYCLYRVLRPVTMALSKHHRVSVLHVLIRQKRHCVSEGLMVYPVQGTYGTWRNDRASVESGFAKFRRRSCDLMASKERSTRCSTSRFNI